MGKHRAYLVASAAFAISAAAFAACGGPQHALPLSSVPGETQFVLSRVPGAVHFAPLVVVNTGNNSITLYAPGSSKPVTVFEGVSAPKAAVFDKAGRLYVANSGSVTVYAPGSTHVLRKMTNGIHSPVVLAFDKAGNLYVANQGNSTVSVYDTRTLSLAHKISNGINVPNALAFDTSGNLYVSNRGNVSGTNGSVTVYASGGTSPKYSITQGIKLPLALALDRSGNLYVANVGTNDVTAYPPGGKTPERTISSGVLVPSALALDGGGNLFVASLVLNRITIYASGSTRVSGSIAHGLNYPNAMAFDSSGALYVSNLRGNAITAYAPKTHKYIRAISRGVSQPSAVHFAPDTVPLPAPSPTAQPSVLPQMLFVSKSGNNEVDGFTLPLGEGPSAAIAITSGLNVPDHLIFDAGNNLFVANLGSSSVLEFAPPYTADPTNIQTGNIGGPHGILNLDPNDNLFFTRCGVPAVGELLPPYTGALVTLSFANNLAASCSGIATDAQGDLFVEDWGGSGSGSGFGSGNVREYQPPISSNSSPVLSIPPVGPSPGPEILALDHRGDLFVAAYTGGNSTASATINAYAPPYGGAPFAVITIQGSWVFGMLFDANDDLFVGTLGQVFEYAPPYKGAGVSVVQSPGCGVSTAMSATGYLYALCLVKEYSANNYILEFAPPFTTNTKPKGYVGGITIFDPFNEGIAISPGTSQSPSRRR